MKSRADKELAGTLDKRFGINSPMQAPLIEGVPDPPIELSKRALAIWYEKASALTEYQALSNLDLQELASYCRELALYHEALDHVESEGAVVSFEQGSQRIKIISHWVKIADISFNRALKLADRLGFSPEARTKIEMTGAKYSSVYDPISALDSDYRFKPRSEQAYVAATEKGWEPSEREYEAAIASGWRVARPERFRFDFGL